MQFFILLLISVFTTMLLFSSSPALAVVNTCPPGMVMIPEGTFKMEADDSGFVEERVAENVTVSSFCIDKYEVTNTQFTEFVNVTNYVTIAEHPLSKEQFPELSDEERLPGSLVFQMPEPGVKQVPLLSWWHWTPGANWQHPFGSDSSIIGKENYPVVHIAYEDALAYAQWAGKSLPTEAQWEYAARGGLEGATYTWGNQYSAKKANTWQGIFPFFNTKADGHVSIAPVGSFPANGYGIYDMTGNVWEWTSNETFDPKKPTETALYVIKGGSYLCAPNYCSRYRPAARESESPDTGTTHIGFRLVKNLQH